MNKNELNLVWYKVLDKVFVNKKVISYQLKQESFVESYNELTRSINIVVEKNFAKKLISTKAPILKQEFAMISGLLTDKFLINGVEFALIEVKKINRQDTTIGEFIDNEDSALQNEKDLIHEETITTDIFIKENTNPFFKGTKHFNLSLYNKNLNRFKHFNLEKKSFHYGNLLILGIVFLPTIIIPLLCYVKYDKYQIYKKEFKKDLDELFLFGYIPENKQSKFFIDKYL
ncbi:MAG: hypothetical protein GQ557_00410 [Mycoplasmataceae bacterium]|nr:hypothetical protein [Mycoplasmataceae bacterium]